MAAALSAAVPGRHAVSCRWDSAYVSGTVMSHAKCLPLVIRPNIIIINYYYVINLIIIAIKRKIPRLLCCLLVRCLPVT